MEITRLLVCTLLFLVCVSSKKKKSRFKKAHEGGGKTQLPEDLQDLITMAQFIQANRPQDLKDFLAKISCDVKMIYSDDFYYDDAADMGLMYPGMMSMLLLSMYGCPAGQVYAARMKMLLGDHGSPRIRDITEVMVTISETAELHDAFLSGYSTGPSGEDKPDLEYGFHKKDGLYGTDTRNVCLEIRDRKRAGTGAPAIDVQDAAKRMHDEMKRWGDHRKNLDAVMMETEIDQLRKVFDEFKKLNAEKSIEDTFTERFRKDHNKRVIYEQLASLIRDKINYTVDEINARLTENEELSLPVANTIAVLGTMTKDDQVKVEAAYEKKFNTKLLEQLDQMLSSATGLQGFIQSFVKLYIDDLKKK